MKKFILGICCIALMMITVRSYALSCSQGDTQVSINANGDITCNSASGGWSYVVPSQTTINQEIAAQNAINTPANLFSKNLFDQQIAQTVLMTNLNIVPFFGAIDRLIDFKNFQGIANMVAGLLLSGTANQTEVDVFENVMENQGINLDSYNSQVNVSY